MTISWTGGSWEMLTWSIADFDNRHHGSFRTPGGLAYFIVGWEYIDVEQNTFHLIGFVDNERNLCNSENHEQMFTFDMYCDCNGTNFDMISRHPNGYNFTANDMQVSAACMY